MAQNDIRSWDETIQAVLGGDRERFREIVMEFQDGLRFVVAYHVRGDDDRIDEIVHCAFVAAYRDLARFEPGRPLWPWLKAIARNEALKEVRRMRRSAQFAREMLHAELMEARADQDPSPERLSKLRRCLEKLKEGAREMVLLRYVQGKRCDAIAQALGRSAGAVRVAMLQVRRSLKLCLEQVEA